MAAIKMCTDISQSKVLAEILPHESADMYYWRADSYPKEDWIIEVGTPDNNYECICAWSLAALLGVFDNKAGLAKEYDLWFCYDNGKSYCTKHYINAIDASCYEMILKLHELKML